MTLVFLLYLLDFAVVSLLPVCLCLSAYICIFLICCSVMVILGCGRQKLAEDLIRKQWHRLVAKLDTDDVVDHLYERKIISFNEMEKVNDTENISRKRKTLLKFIVKRPWVDGVQFATILSGSEANHELGRMLLCNAGGWVISLCGLFVQGPLQQFCVMVLLSYCTTPHVHSKGRE